MGSAAESTDPPSLSLCNCNSEHTSGLVQGFQTEPDKGQPWGLRPADAQAFTAELPACVGGGVKLGSVPA